MSMSSVSIPMVPLEPTLIVVSVVIVATAFAAIQLYRLRQTRSLAVRYEARWEGVGAGAVLVGALAALLLLADVVVVWGIVVIMVMAAALLCAIYMLRRGYHGPRPQRPTDPPAQR